MGGRPTCEVCATSPIYLRRPPVQPTLRARLLCRRPVRPRVPHPGDGDGRLLRPHHPALHGGGPPRARRLRWGAGSAAAVRPAPAAGCSGARRPAKRVPPAPSRGPLPPAPLPSPPPAPGRRTRAACRCWRRAAGRRSSGRSRRARRLRWRWRTRRARCTCLRWVECWGGRRGWGHALGKRGGYVGGLLAPWGCLPDLGGAGVADPAAGQRHMGRTLRSIEYRMYSRRLASRARTSGQHGAGPLVPHCLCPPAGPPPAVGAAALPVGADVPRVACRPRPRDGGV